MYKIFKKKNMSDKCCTPFIEGEGCNSALQKKASNVASGDFSTAVGHGTIASNEGELSAGKYNEPNAGQLFSVGIGTSDSNRKNAMQINSDGSASFLYNGALVPLAEFIHNVNDGSGNRIKMGIVDGYIKVSYDNGQTWENVIALSELQGDPGSGLEDVVVVDGGNNGGNPNVTATFDSGILRFVFTNLQGAIQAATSSKIGGIKVGRQVSGKQYPVELDADSRAYVYVPWSGTGGGNLEPATSTTLGGIKTGFSTNNENRVYAVELTEQYKAYVRVPWTSSGEGGGTDGGHFELIFTVTQTDEAPSLPEDQTVIDDTGTWKHYADDSSITGDYYVWMASRWCPGGDSPDNWEGPWLISGNTGNAGADGKGLEFIYRRTTSETTPSQPASSGTGTVGGVATVYANTIDDWVPQNWTDSPTGIDSTNKYEWMCFRVKTGGFGGEGGTWSAFTSPVLWSAYGKNGTDGDGLEYIFFAGATAPTENPATWNKSTAGENSRTWEERDFIKDGFGSVWLDNPIDLDSPSIPAGTKQWVSIRKKYADTASNRSNYTSSTNTDDPYWHAYSSPALWSYKAKDGLPGSGIVADLDNEMVAVPLDDNGDSIAIQQSTNAILYSSGSPISSTVTLVSIIDTDSPVGTYDNTTDFNSGNTPLVTIDGNQVTIAISDGDVNLANKNLLINLRLTSTANNSVYGNVTLTLVGIHFGSDGSSYRLGLNCRAIRHSEGVINPQYIEATCIKTTGLNPGAVYTPAVASISTLNALVPKTFCFKYEVDDSGTISDLNTAQLATSSIQDNVRIMLYYGDDPTDMTTLVLVDQETLYVISDGITPSARYKSVVFKRSATRPTIPNANTVDVNPVGSDTADARGVTNEDYGGTFADPIPYGWSDGIPAYDNSLSATENTLWMTTRLFIESATDSYQTTWTTPQQASDMNEYDIEFAYAQTNDTFPATPSDGPNSDGVNGNRHGCNPSSGQIWFDPDLDSNEDFSDMVWRAERYTRNGVSEDWVITRIAGEVGRGISAVTTVYGISNSASTIPGDNSWVQNITSLNPIAGDWVWSKMTVTYTDGSTPDVFYTKYRQVSDGVNGQFTALTFRGAYEDDVNYYANLDRTDVVYHRGSSKYYRANPLANTNNLGYFSDIEPSVTQGWHDYWIEFGENYDNIATGLILAEDANIANFLFHNERLESMSVDGDDRPNLILDGRNGQLIANDAIISGEINAKSGTIGPLTVGHDSAANIDFLKSTYTGQASGISGTYNLTNELQIDGKKFKVSADAENTNNSSIYSEGLLTAGLKQNGGGFVEINCDQTVTSPYAGAPHYDCGLKVNASGTVNALEVVGNAFVDGTLSGRVPIVTDISDLPGYKQSPASLTYKDSGAVVWVENNNYTINLNSDVLNYPGFNFRLILRHGLSTTISTASGINATWCPRDYQEGIHQDSTTSSYTINHAGIYDIIYAGQSTVGSTTYSIFIVVYYHN